jgi:hypothetical protein
MRKQVTCCVDRAHSHVRLKKLDTYTSQAVLQLLRHASSRVDGFLDAAAERAIFLSVCVAHLRGTPILYKLEII